MEARGHDVGSDLIWENPIPSPAPGAAQSGPKGRAPLQAPFFPVPELKRSGLNLAFAVSVRRRGLVLVKGLQDKIRHLLLSVRSNQTLSIPSVLDVGQGTPRRAKIAQNPRRGAAPRRNRPKHGKRLAVEFRLVFLAKPRQVIAVEALQCVRSDFTDDHGLGISEGPRG